MKTIITVALVFGSLYGRTQSIEKQVIGSMGGISSGGSYQMDCTVGEAVIDTFSSGSILVYQGYHHAIDSHNNTSVGEIITLQWDYLLFPNPTRNQATLRFSGVNSPAQLSVQVYSVAGKLISMHQVEVGHSFSSGVLIDLTNESSGVYFIKITEPKSKFTKSLRLVKQ